MFAALKEIAVNFGLPISLKESSPIHQLLPRTMQCVLLDEFNYPTGEFTYTDWEYEKHRYQRYTQKDSNLFLHSHAIVHTPDDSWSKTNVIRCAVNGRGERFIVEKVTGKSGYGTEFRYIPLEQTLNEDPTLRFRLLVFGVNLAVGRETGFLRRENAMVRDVLRRVGHSRFIDSSLLT